MLKLAVCEKIDSTQLKLIEAVKNGLNDDSFALLALQQTNGIGSNNRIWVGEDEPIKNLKRVFFLDYFKDLEFIFCDYYRNYDLDFCRNLYLSFYCDSIPDDLPIQSASIYYASILKMVLQDFNSKVFIKWPNDIYLDNKKVGGVISTKVKNKLICGIGLNIVFSPQDAKTLDTKIDLQILLKAFFDKISEKISWRDVFDYYKNDFELSRLFCFKQDDKIYHLNDAKLYGDGSILIDDKRIYSLR